MSDDDDAYPTPTQTAVYLENKKGKDQIFWSNFLREENGVTAMCKICSVVLKTTGGCTSGMRRHLRLKHPVLSEQIQGSTPIKLKPPKPPKNQIEIEKIEILSSIIPKKIKSAKPKKPKPPATLKAAPKSEPKNDPKVIVKVVPQLSETLPLVLARMASLDGIPFHTLVNSQDIRLGLVARGFWDVPTTEEDCRQLVISHYALVKQSMVNEFHRLKEQGIRFSVKLEEWTSVRDRRYINVNLRNELTSWNLGIVRVDNGGPAAKIMGLITAKLGEFGIFLEPDVVAITADGATAMQKIGKLLPVMQQACIAQGLQSAIIQLLYAPNDNSNPEQFPQDTHFLEIEAPDIEMSDVEDEIEEANFNMFSVDIQDAPQLDSSHDELGPLIHKVREVIKIFKRAHTANDSVLQRYILQLFGVEIQLKLDCKTRWSSTCEMLETFYKVRSCIKKALYDIEVTIEFSDYEYKCMENIVAVLLPVKLAVEVLCRRDGNLITADAALQFMFDRMAEVDGDFSEQLKSVLSEQVCQRRTEASAVLQFLHGQSNNTAFKFKVASKNTAAVFVIGLIQRLNVHAEDMADEFAAQLYPAYEEDNERDVEKLIQDQNASLQEKLDRAISSAVTPKFHRARNTGDTEGSVMREVEIFVTHNVRGEHLEKCYKYLLTVQPSSVEAERAFSTSSVVCPSISSRLNDETLDILCFLKEHFQHNK